MTATSQGLRYPEARRDLDIEYSWDHQAQPSPPLGGGIQWIAGWVSKALPHSITLQRFRLGALTVGTPQATAADWGHIKASCQLARSVLSLMPTPLLPLSDDTVSNSVGSPESRTGQSGGVVTVADIATL